MGDKNSKEITCEIYLEYKSDIVAITSNTGNLRHSNYSNHSELILDKRLELLQNYEVLLISKYN